MKNYKRIQKLIQDTYMIMFTSWSMVLIFVSKFSTFEDMKWLILGVAITGALTIGKGITHYRKNPKKARQEIYEAFRSERG